MSNLVILLFYFPSTKSVIFANFTLLVIVRGLRSCSNSVWSLIDAVTMKMVADKKDYGKHRLFASLAWGLNGVIAGKLIDLYGMDTMFTLSVFWAVITCGLLLFCMPQIVPSEQHNADHQDVEMGAVNTSKSKRDSVDLFRTFRLLMSMRRDYQFMSSLLMMLIYNNTMYIVDRILYIQMDQELGATKLMNGIATLCMLTAILHHS